MVPYSNSHLVTLLPSGLTVAFSVAVVLATRVAASVLTVGGGIEAVVNSLSVPSPVPPALVATRRKW